MKLLCTSTDHAFTIEVRLALDEAGIDTFSSDADSSLAGIGAAVGSKTRIYLLDDADWSAAVDIVSSLERSTREAPASEPSRHPFPVWLIVVVSALCAAVLGLALTSTP